MARSAWLRHVMAVKAKNKGMAFKNVLKMAKKSYKRVGGGVATNAGLIEDSGASAGAVEELPQDGGEVDVEQQDGGNSHDNVIDFVYIATTGNAFDFGDITSSYLVNGAAAGSTTRSVYMGGGIAGPTYAAQSVMDYVTFTTKGNATKFGDLRVATKHHNATSDSVRAMIAGGSNSDTDLIQYINVSTEGTSVDFGNLTSGRYGAGVCSNGHGGLG